MSAPFGHESRKAGCLTPGGIRYSSPLLMAKPLRRSPAPKKKKSPAPKKKAAPARKSARAAAKPAPASKVSSKVEVLEAEAPTPGRAFPIEIDPRAVEETLNKVKG